MQRLLLHPPRLLAALGLLATAGAAQAQAPVAASQAVTVQLSPGGMATLQAASVNNGSTGSGNTYTIQKIRYGQVNEGSTLTLAAPTGFTFTSSVPFASYGTPGGSNGNYTVGSCNSGNSASVVNGILSGQNAGSIGASNNTFGDPCYGTGKSLAVVAAYSTNAASQTYSPTELGSDNYVLLTATNASGSSTRTAQVTVVPYANNALAFDGSNDYVGLPTSTPVPVGNSAYTIEAWIKPTSMGVYGIVGWGNYGTTNQVNALRLDPANGGSLRNYWWANDLNVTVGNLADGKWHHVAATFDGTTRAIYVDGIFKGSDTPSGLNVPNANNMRLGVTCATCPQTNGYAVEYFPGGLDEVRIYNVGLTQAQVQADMYSANGTAAVPASQKYYANFDQGTAGGTNAGLTSLTDQSGNGSTGTLTNFALTGTSSNWVRSFPTITAISPSSGKSGTSVTVTGTNLTDATGFKFNGLASSGFTTPGSDITTTSTAPVGVMTGPVSVASATLMAYNGPVFTLVNDLVVTNTQSIPGDSYSSITVQSGGNGTLAGDVTVSGPIVVNSGGRLADGCNLFTGSGSFTLNAGGSFDICRPRGILSGPNTGLGNIGAVRVLGTRTYSNDASYSYSGNQSQDTGDGLPSQVRNFTVSTGSDLGLTNPLAVAQVLTLTGNGNLTLGSKALTLLSSAAGTALVVNSGAGVVQGTATVQRYIDASGNTGTSGYRHYSAPVSGMAFGALATTSTGGSFTPIVGSTAYNQAANTSTVTPYPNVYGYDQSRVGSTTLATNLTAFDQGYFSPTNATLTVGQGYTVQIGNGEKVNFTGTLNTGTQTIGSLQRGANAAGGWQLIGNPYPAPLDWGTVGASGTGSSLNGVDPAAYVFQSTSGYAGRYTSFNNGVGAGSGLLATGQAFFVRANSASSPGTVTLTNANRTTTYAAAPAFQRTAETRPLLRLSLAAGSQPTTTATAQDETFVYFETGATGDFDGHYDAYKLPNPSGLYLGTAAQVPSGALPTGLSIDGRAPLAAGTSLSVPVWLSVAAGTYTLTATELLNFAGMGNGTSVALLDALTGTTTNLAAVPSYTFAVAANAPSTGRFTLLFGPATPLATTSPALAQAQVSLYPNPTEGAATLAVAGLPAAARHVQATLSDALGRPVGRVLLALNQGVASAPLPTQGLAAGLYVLRLDVLNAQSQVLGQLPAQRLSVR